MRRIDAGQAPSRQDASQRLAAGRHSGTSGAGGPGRLPIGSVAPPAAQLGRVPNGSTDDVGGADTGGNTDHTGIRLPPRPERVTDRDSYRRFAGASGDCAIGTAASLTSGPIGGNSRFPLSAIVRLGHRRTGSNDCAHCDSHEGRRAQARVQACVKTFVHLFPVSFIHCACHFDQSVEVDTGYRAGRASSRSTNVTGQRHRFPDARGEPSGRPGEDGSRQPAGRPHPPAHQLRGRRGDPPPAIDRRSRRRGASRAGASHSRPTRATNVPPRRTNGPAGRAGCRMNRGPGRGEPP